MLTILIRIGNFPDDASLLYCIDAEILLKEHPTTISYVHSCRDLSQGKNNGNRNDGGFLVTLIFYFFFALNSNQIFL